MGLVLGVPAASWASLGGFLGGLVDTGGAHRAGAANFGALGLVGGLPAAAGAVVGRHVVVAVAAMFAFGLGANLLRVYRSAFANVVGPAVILFAASLTAARRRMSLAALDAEGALQWLVAERGASDPAVEAMMTVATYVRRLATSVTALALLLETQHGTQPEWLLTFEQRALGALHEAAVGVASGRPPPPIAAGALLDVRDADVGAALHGAAERIARQLVVLRQAVARLATSR